MNNHNRKRMSLSERKGIRGFYRTKIRPHITKKRVIIAAISMFVAIMILPIATYAYYARDIGDRERLMNRNNTGIILKDRNGTTFYSSGVLSTKDDLSLADISDDVEKAVVASEDQSFYSHHGFSTRGTVRALFSNISSGDSTGSGGSTLTQQLVKNKLLNSQKNYIRKFQELSMAVAVERKYSKQEILEMYLNSAYFGDGAFGINDAAHTYFAKDASQLNLAESSMLIGLLPAPSAYSPVSGDAKLAKEAQANVLRKMTDTGKITNDQRQAALSTELAYSSDAKKGGAEYAQHFADMVTAKLEETYGEERTRRGGFVVTTTLDLDKQKRNEQIIKDRVAQTSARGGRNAGLVTINPKNGQILSLVGSVDYYNTEFGRVNMATALRQPGSTFKPIYYSDAIARGLITAGTIVDDQPRSWGSYKPNNFDNRFKGKMSVRSALGESRNIPAVEIMQKEGITNAAKAAQRMGLSTVNEPQKYGLSMALGVAESRLLQMTNAYAAFANQGTQYDPVMYTKVVDKYNQNVPVPDTSRPKQVLDKGAAYITASILSDTAARAPTYGSSLNISGKNVALKTGTTNDSKDGWLIGFTPSVVTGVWMGNNESEPMRGGLAGGSGAGSIWKPIMTADLQGAKRETFPMPSGVVATTICVGTNDRSVNADGGTATKTEYYLKGEEPTGTCNTQAAPKPEEEKKQENNDEQPDTEDTTTPTPGTTTSGNGTTSPGTGTGTGTGSGSGGTTPGTGTGAGGGSGGTTPRNPTNPRNP